eukprot:scaffold11937_cov71-Cylindrotheca_fusiformis.AAC.2
MDEEEPMPAPPPFLVPAAANNPTVLMETCPEGITQLEVAQHLCYDQRLGILSKTPSWAVSNTTGICPSVIPCAQLVTCPTCKTKKDWACCHMGHTRYGIRLFSSERRLLRHLQGCPHGEAYQQQTHDKTREDVVEGTLLDDVASQTCLEEPAASPPHWDLGKIAADAQNLPALSLALKDYLTYDGSSKPNKSSELFRILLQQYGFDYSLVVRCIIYMSCSSCGGTNYPKQLLESIDLSSYSMFLDLSILSFSLCKAELTYLSKIISYFVNSQEHHLGATLDMSDERTRNQFLFIPTGLKNIHSRILSPSRMSSLRNILPIPHVTAMPDGLHSYADFVEMIRYTALCPTVTDFVVPDRYQSLTKSTKYLSLKKQPAFVQNSIETVTKNVVVLILFWGDGFDPNRSKTNRGSAWALTATYFFIDPNEDRVYQMKTKLIAVGPDKKSKSHFSVFQQMKNDFHGHDQEAHGGCPVPIRGTSRYHGGGQLISFYPVILGALFDNPERRSNFGLRMGNSSNHVYFGISSHFNRLQLPFHACENCVSKIREYCAAQSFSHRCRPSCDQCLSFSTQRLLESGHYTSPIFVPPAVAGVVENEIPGIGFASAPGKLTRDLLKRAWKYALDRFLADQYTPEHIRRYLGDMLCLNSAEVERFLSEARELLHIRDIEHGDYQGEVQPPQHIAELLKILNDDPNYARTLCQHPPIWDLLELDEAFETTMHNAMNTGKAEGDYLFQWAASHREATATLQKAGPLFGMVKQLRMEDFKALVFTTQSFGGYVGENWKCFHQLGPWAFSFLDSPDMQRTIVDPPSEKPIDRYTAAELKAWLLCRHISVPSAARKSELHNLVLVSQANGAPTNPVASITVGPGIQGSQMRRMILASSEYFASLMSNTVTTMSGKKERQHRSESLAMLLLAEITGFLRMVPSENIDIGKEVRKKSTLFGLLRTPCHFAEVDQVRALQEGGTLGEGMVKVLRQYLQHGLKENWTVSMHQRALRDESLSFLQSALTTPCSIVAGAVVEPPPPDPRAHLNKFHRYKSFADAIACWQRNECLSLVMYRWKLPNDIADSSTPSHWVYHFGVVVAEGHHRWTYRQFTADLEDPSCHHDPLGFSYFPTSFSEVDSAPSVEIKECNRYSMTLTCGDEDVDGSFSGAIVGLPLKQHIRRAAPGQHLYAFLDSEGLSLSQEGEFR